MATKEEIIEYVMNSPQNTNRSVLSSMLEHMESASAAYSIVYDARFIEPTTGAPTSATAGQMIGASYDIGEISSLANLTITIFAGSNSIPFIPSIIQGEVQDEYILNLEWCMPAHDIVVSVTENVLRPLLP